jgi:hypothetical protein
MSSKYDYTGKTVYVGIDRCTQKFQGNRIYFTDKAHKSSSEHQLSCQGRTSRRTFLRDVVNTSL